MVAIMMLASTDTLDQLLEPLEESMTPELAKMFAELRASPQAQARLELLAARHSAGERTAVEEAEYTSLVHAGAVIISAPGESAEEVGV
jgi:hypothetical protein